MTLVLPDAWAWDFWLVRDGEDVHLFHLSAPRSLGDPEERHLNARIGHAVSRDLRTWEPLGPALPEAPPGAPDDLASWTGCVVHDGRRWQMVYTAISRAQQRSVQRIVSAVSDDLITWERTSLALPADPERFEPRHWRDPWVVRDDAAGLWRMFVTTRLNTGDPASRGVVASLTSPDLTQWEAGPLVAGPGEFRQMEVPQVLPCGDRWALLFCAGDQDHGPARLARGAAAESGTHVYYGDAAEGPFRAEHDDFLSGDNGPSLFAGRAVEHDGRWWFLAWRRLDAAGRFVGEISDPYPIDVVDGRLRVDFTDDRRRPGGR